MFFNLPEVDAKYFNKNGDADPVISVVISYNGKLSEAPLAIADRVFETGGHIALKDGSKQESQKPGDFSNQEKDKPEAKKPEPKKPEREKPETDI